jgi:hypothetical protein
MQRGQFLRHDEEGPTGSLMPDALPEPRALTNADRTRTVRRKGPETFVIAVGELVLGRVPSAVEPTWSRSNPATLYTVGGETQHSILVNTIGPTGDTTIEQLNLDWLALPLTLAQRIGNLAVSDESLAICFGGAGQDDHCYAGVLYEGETQLAFLIDTRTEPGCGFLLRSVSIEPSGRFVVLEPADGPLVIWDTHQKTYTPVKGA